MFILEANHSRNVASRYSIFVRFEYNPNYIAFIKSFKKRSYNPQTKEWELAYEEAYAPLLGFLQQNNLIYNKEDFDRSIQKLIEEATKAQAIQETKHEIDISALDNIDFKLMPRSYQKEGIAYGLANDKFLLADSMGLGKSLQITNIARLKRGGEHCLIIVGYDALQFNWVSEISKCSNETAYVIGQREVKSGKNKGKIVKGTIKDRIDDLKNIDQIKDFFLITSVTTLREAEKEEYLDKNGKKKYRYNFIVANLIEELCKTGKIGRIVFDEAQVVKSYEALQTQALLKLESCPYKIAATGTPIMNSHIDLYPLMLWLGKETCNYYAFREQYCQMGGFKNKQIIGNKNGDILNRKLNCFMLRRKKEDVLDLPEKIFINELLEMDLKQANLYDKVKKQTKAELSKMKGNKAALLGSLIKLRQITCHPQWVDERYKDSVKFDRVYQLVNEIISNHQKVIIFSNWATPIEWLYESMKHLNPAIITGASKDRMEQVNRFQNDDTCKVIVGTGGAMGTGLTLTAASNVIFLDEPWNAALKDQWTDRAHRIGTKNNVNIYTLMCKGTVDDEIVHKKVKNKGILSANVIDGISIEELEAYFENF